MASLHPAGPPTGVAGVAPRTRAGGLLCEQIIAELDQLEGVTLGSLLALYFDEADRQVAEIAAAIGRGDPRALGETAHQLRGSSSTMGAAHVARIAAGLEASADAGDLAVAGDLLVGLRTGLQDTRQAFRGSRAVAGTAPQPDPMTPMDGDRSSATPEKTR